MTQRLFDFRALVNYWVSDHPALACVIIFVPYLLGAAIIMAFQSLVVFIVATVFVMALVFIRTFDPLSQSWNYSDEAKDYLSNRWLKRGNNQYVYITPIEGVGFLHGKIEIQCLTLNPSLYFSIVDHEFPWLVTYDSYWGEWSFSHVRKVTRTEEDFIKEQLQKARVKK